MKRRPSDRTDALRGLLPRRVHLLLVAVLALAAPAAAAADDTGDHSSSTPAVIAGTSDQAAGDTVAPGAGSEPVAPAEADPPSTDPPAIDPPVIDPPAIEPPVIEPPVIEPPADPTPPEPPVIQFPTIPNPPAPPVPFDGGLNQPPLTNPTPTVNPPGGSGPSPEQHTEQPTPTIVETPTLPVGPRSPFAPPTSAPVPTGPGPSATPDTSGLSATSPLATPLPVSDFGSNTPAGAPAAGARHLIASLPGPLTPTHSADVYTTGLARLLGLPIPTPGTAAPVTVGLPSIAAAVTHVQQPVVSSHDEPVPAPARAPPADPSGPGSAAAGGAGGSGGNHAGGSVLALAPTSSDLFVPAAHVGRCAPRATIGASARPAHTRGRAPPVS